MSVSLFFVKVGIIATPIIVLNTAMSFLVMVRLNIFMKLDLFLKKPQIPLTFKSNKKCLKTPIIFVCLSYYRS